MVKETEKNIISSFFPLFQITLKTFGGSTKLTVLHLHYLVEALCCISQRRLLPYPTVTCSRLVSIYAFKSQSIVDSGQAHCRSTSSTQPTWDCTWPWRLLPLPSHIKLIVIILVENSRAITGNVDISHCKTARAISRRDNPGLVGAQSLHLKLHEHGCLYL